MNTRIFYTSLSLLCLLGGVVMLKSTSTVSSQISASKPADHAQSDRLQIIQNKAFRQQNWETLVNAIEQEKSYVEVRGLNGKDEPSADMITALVGLLDWERPKTSR